MKVTVVVTDATKQPEPHIMWMVSMLVNLCNTLLNQACEADPNLKVLAFTNEAVVEPTLTEDTPTNGQTN